MIGVHRFFGCFFLFFCIHLIRTFRFFHNLYNNFIYIYFDRYFAVALIKTIKIKFAAFFYYVNRKSKSYFELKPT